MKFYTFGEAENPVILLLPGTCCHWKLNFGEVIPLLEQHFHVVCVSYDGFDETEDSIFPDMITETEKIETYIKENFDAPIILDAYAGIATIGIIMSDVAKKVVSVEENKQSIETAREVLKDNDIQNVEVYCDDTSNYLSQISEKMFDITILDPPRKGCSQVSLDKTLEVTKSRIIYISCNPQTLARDLDYLKSKGARVCSVQPFDMFCHSTHVESVAIIEL